MVEILRHINGSDLVVFGMIVICFGGGLILVGWSLWLKHRSDELHTELKHEMLARGMSADEIVRVLNAGDPKKAVKSQTADRNRT